MDAATSADADIADDQRGEGPGGRRSPEGDFPADGYAAASRMAPRPPLPAVTWDRRARGASGDRRGSTPEDEVADLAAVIEAVGGEAIVLGHSSGAVLALRRFAGAPIRARFFSEPPFRFRVDEPADRFRHRLQRLVDEGEG